MAQLDITKYRPYLIIGSIIVLSLFTFWMRGLTADMLMTPSGVDLMGNDPWYNLRQVEQVVAHFPGYAWFDAMTLYPHGDTVYWGPLFIYIISALSILVGASTRPELMVVGSWVPPLMAAAMVPIMYGIGAKLADWKTGLLAAGLISVVSGQYVYRSLFGFVDHHIAETLFSTLFVLVYVIALVSVKDKTVDLRRLDTLKGPGTMAFLAGIAYLLGLYTMPTMVLFALVVAVFTLIQFVWDFYRGRSSEYLVLLNVIVFGVAIVGMAATGFPHPGLDLSRYTFGHVVVYGTLIIGTLALYGLSVYLKGRPKYYYPLALAGVVVIGAAGLFIVAPDLYSLLVSSLFAFFGSQAVTTTVQEARAWTVGDAWNVFGIGLFLMFGGFATLIWRYREKSDPAQIFVLVWSLVILLSTIAHVRYEYYLAANVALLSAVFAGAVLSFGWEDVKRLVRPEKGGNQADPPASRKPEEPVKKAKKGGKGTGVQKPKATRRDQPNYLKAGAFIGIALITALFVGISFQTDLGTVAIAEYSGMNADWKEALEWMGANTPDPGIDYYAIYDQNAFQYPNGSYGVMSWWDYGHWITFTAKRIPNANPFQHGVAGPEGSAAYFTSTSEATANGILDALGTKYVITDVEMDTGKFWAMATWANATAGVTPFQPTFLIPADQTGQSYQTVPLTTQQYYLTMVSRLHNFDGSMTEPLSQVYYVEYKDPSAAKMSLPVITNAVPMNASAAQAAADAYNQNASPGSHATVLNLYYQAKGDSIVQPVAQVPALQHYRLVHESPKNVFSASATAPNVKYVKIFEYVPGAHIKGDGVIEVPVITNTGREFTYRQASVNGEFIVPYATSGWSGDVKANGQYRIVGTGQTFDVTEEAIQQGSTIN
jgi:oligosaccharyl transferase (archaeosortase A-associated)